MVWALPMAKRSLPLLVSMICQMTVQIRMFNLNWQLVTLSQNWMVKMCFGTPADVLGKIKARKESPEVRSSAFMKPCAGGPGESKDGASSAAKVKGKTMGQLFNEFSLDSNSQCFMVMPWPCTQMIQQQSTCSGNCWSCAHLWPVSYVWGLSLCLSTIWPFKYPRKLCSPCCCLWRCKHASYWI